MSRLFVLLVAVLAPAPAYAQAWEPWPEQPGAAAQKSPSPKAPTPSSTLDTSSTTPRSPAPVAEAAPAQPEQKSHAAREPAVGPPSFFANSILLNAHVLTGVEPHLFGNPVAFNIGGEALYRGVVGVGLGLYSSEGSPLTSTSSTPPGLGGLGDRVSVALSLAVRPLAPFAWHRGDSYLARLLGGFGMEAGGSVEYIRTGSFEISGCGIPANSLGAAFHYGVSLEVPLVGNAQHGWVSLRASERIIVGDTAHLAPTQPRNQPCSAQIVEPGVASQILFGLSYSL